MWQCHFRSTSVVMESANRRWLYCDGTVRFSVLSDAALGWHIFLVMVWENVVLWFWLSYRDGSPALVIF